LFISAGNRGRWPASVKLVTLPYLGLGMGLGLVTGLGLAYVVSCVHSYIQNDNAVCHG